ncbi:MAG: 2-phospho-L-lactate transferase [Acidimicrobiia bacterium]|nr:2-phospho-L-lactate transferase [Acidimicrobiia bacterium]
MICVLAGGVGAARFLAGLQLVVDPAEIVAIVNVGDDFDLHGLAISPDLDTVTYTLAGAVNPDTGWGLVGETWSAMQALERYGGATWFRLGDQDLATHLYRTQRRNDGAPLSVVTAEIAAAWRLGLRLVPVTDDPVRTMVTLAESGDEITFQEYFVHRQHSVAVSAVRFEGAERSRPAPGVIDAIADAEIVVVAPSNPIVSIGPVLAVPGVRAAIESRREDCVAVSPIVGGAALKGPADRMLRELGHEASVEGVARLYRSLARTLLVDEVDAASAEAVRAAGMEPLVAPSIMSSPERAAALARTVLASARRTSPGAGS